MKPLDVTYLDTSVALVHVLAEDRRPPDELWERTLVSSHLLEFEMWTRIHARGLTRSHGEVVRALLGAHRVPRADPGGAGAGH